MLGVGHWFRRTAWRLGLIDGPKLRGLHAEPVAKSGGLTIVAALVTALIVQLAVARSMGEGEAYLTDVNYLYLLLPALGLAALGFMDDLRPLGAAPKLIFQTAAATAAYFILDPLQAISFAGFAPIELGPLAPLVTIIFIVAVTNAFNMIDGVDGLCSGAAFIALAGIGIYSMPGGEFRLELALPLAAAALAFLRFNLGKPKAFLGDSGSMFLGFMVAALSLKAVTVTPAGPVDVVPLFLFLSLPIVDITTVFFRRILQGNSPLRADRGHIHHILILLFDGGARRTTGTLLFMAALGAAGAIAVHFYPPAAGAAIALPMGLYLAIYAGGGYASGRNLRNAGAATDNALLIAQFAEQSGAREALNAPELIELLKLADIRGLALMTDEGRRVWSVGTPDTMREALRVPLYASGRVNRGALLVQGNGRVGAMAFAAHLLLPLYPAFMELLALEEAGQVRKVTATIKR